MTSASKIVAFPARPERRHRDELAFLQAALEIVETPPSPVGRMIAATIMLLFCAAPPPHTPKRHNAPHAFGGPLEASRLHEVLPAADARMHSGRRS